MNELSTECVSVFTKLCATFKQLHFNANQYQAFKIWKKKCGMKILYFLKVFPFESTE